jgi:hypothetical protein
MGLSVGRGWHLRFFHPSFTLLALLFTDVFT